MPARKLEDMVAEAKAAVPALEPAQAITMLAREDVIFVDVRESDERRHGFIPASLHVPRGFLELMSDPRGPAHNPALASGKTLVIYCASGIRSLLAAKTLADMGVENVHNLSGGLQGWVRQSGPLVQSS